MAIILNRVFRLWIKNNILKNNFMLLLFLCWIGNVTIVNAETVNNIKNGTSYALCINKSKTPSERLVCIGNESKLQMKLMNDYSNKLMESLDSKQRNLLLKSKQKDKLILMQASWLEYQKSAYNFDEITSKDNLDDEVLTAKNFMNRLIEHVAYLKRKTNKLQLEKFY